MMVGLDPEKFWRLTMRELTNAVEGWKRKEQIEWERVRMLAYYSVSPYAKKSFKISDIKLPGDEERDVDFTSHGEAKKLTREELKESWRRSGLILSEEKLDELYGNSSTKKS